MQNEWWIDGGTHRDRKSTEWSCPSEAQEQHNDGNGGDEGMEQEDNQEVLRTEAIKQAREKKGVCRLFDSGRLGSQHDRILKLRCLQDHFVEEPVSVFVADRVAVPLEKIQGDLGIIEVLHRVIAPEGNAEDRQMQQERRQKQAHDPRLVMPETLR